MSDLPPRLPAGHGRRIGSRGALRRSWPLIPALAVLLVFSVGLGFTKFGRAAVTSAFFLPDMMAPLPIRPVTWTTSTPVKESITIHYGSKRCRRTSIARAAADARRDDPVAGRAAAGAGRPAAAATRRRRGAGGLRDAGAVFAGPDDEMIYPQRGRCAGVGVPVPGGAAVREAGQDRLHRRQRGGAAGAAGGVGLAHQRPGVVRRLLRRLLRRQRRPQGDHDAHDLL